MKSKRTVSQARRDLLLPALLLLALLLLAILLSKSFLPASPTPPPTISPTVTSLPSTATPPPPTPTPQPPATPVAPPPTLLAFEGESIRGLSTDAGRGIVLVAAGDRLYYSADAGATFTDITPAQGRWAPLIMPDALLALGPVGADHPTLARSSNRGQSWAPVSELPCAASHLEFQPGTGTLVAWGYPVVEDFCFVYSTDRGLTWAMVPTPSDEGLLRPLGFGQDAFYTAVRHPDRHDDLFHTTSFTDQTAVATPEHPPSTTRYLDLFSDQSSRSTHILGSVAGVDDVWSFAIANTFTLAARVTTMPEEIVGTPPSVQMLLSSGDRRLALSPRSGRLYERVAWSRSWTPLCDGQQRILSWDVVTVGDAARVLLGTNEGLAACDLPSGSAYAYQLLRISVPRISARGSLAYVEEGQLIVADIDGQRVVAQGVTHDIEWSPDGERLFYTAEQDGSAARYAWDAATGEGRPAEEAPPTPQPDPLPTTLPQGFVAAGPSPLASPDGRWLALHVERIAAPDVDYTLISDTTDISPTRVITAMLPVAWSPDGALLAGRACNSVDCAPAVFNTRSGEVTPVAPPTVQNDLGELPPDFSLTWSPQGTYLAHGLDGHRGPLLLWDRASGQSRVLLAGSGFTDIGWMPDGCGLYVAQREPGGGANAPVRTIWGVGPNWDHVWSVAPMGEADVDLTLCPTSTLTGRRLIAYYGTPAGPGLGILGRHGLSETLTLLQEQIAEYEALDPDTAYVPALHMVTTIADAYPGEDGDYNHRVAHDVIQPWIDGARAAGGLSILDIQPAHAEVGVELALIEPLLRQPAVHLAVDPEFIMAADDHIPGTDLGSISGEEINRIQAWLDALARETGERKMLIIHQFNDRMMRDKGAILHYPMVDLVWDSDGFGSPGAKIGDYIQYSGETGFEYGGFKIFYRYDTPVMTPEQVLELRPLPGLVIYQ